MTIPKERNLYYRKTVQKCLFSLILKYKWLVFLKSFLLHERGSYLEYLREIWKEINKKNSEKLKFKDVSILIGSLIGSLL